MDPVQAGPREAAKPGETSPDTTLVLSAIPWEDRDRLGTFTAFWRTVWYVMARNGRLGRELGSLLNPYRARSFRRMAVIHSVVGTLAVFGLAMVLGLLVNGPSAPILIAPIAVTLLWWLTAAFLNGALNWFLCPTRLDGDQQTDAMALGCYLSAPLALQAALLPLPLVAAAQSVPCIKGVLVAGSVALLACLVYWYQLVLCGMASICGRRPAGSVAAAIGLTLVWAVLYAGIWLLPATVAIWLAIWASLA